jgi:hypothetical protein
MITSPALASTYEISRDGLGLPRYKIATPFGTHGNILLQPLAMRTQIIKGRIESLRMVIQDLDNPLNPILGDHRPAAAREYVGETVDDRQGVRGRIQEMPEIVVVDVPTGVLLGFAFAALSGSRWEGRRNREPRVSQRLRVSTDVDADLDLDLRSGQE